MHNNKNNSLISLPTQLKDLIVSDAAVSKFLQKALACQKHNTELQSLLKLAELSQARSGQNHRVGLAHVTHAIDRISHWENKWAQFSDRLFVNVLPMDATQGSYQTIKNSFKSTVINSLYVSLNVDDCSSIPLAINAVQHPFLNFKVDYREYIKVLAEHIFDLRILMTRYPNQKEKLSVIEKSASRLLRLIKDKKKKRRKNSQTLVVKYVPCLLNQNNNALYLACRDGIENDLIGTHERFSHLDDQLVPLYVDFSQSTNIMLSVDRGQLITMAQQAIHRLKTLQSKYTSLPYQPEDKSLKTS